MSAGWTPISAVRVISDAGIVNGKHYAGIQITTNGSACTTHLVATQTGVTFTDTHDPATDPETTTGGDMGMCVNRATVLGAGTTGPRPHK